MHKTSKNRKKKSSHVTAKFVLRTEEKLTYIGPELLIKYKLQNIIVN